MKKFALLLLAAPLALAACGGGSTSAQGDPLAAVKQAGQKTAETSRHATSTESYSNATATMVGDFTSSPPTGSVDVSAKINFSTTKFTFVVSGTQVYEKQAYLGPGKTWAMVDVAKLKNPSMVDPAMVGALSPVQALQTLEAAGTVTEVGAETIDGVATTHYRVTDVDLSKLPPGATPAVLVRPKYGPINVWIGTTDGYVHRENISVTETSHGPGGPTLTMAVNFSKFGEALIVDVPTATETMDYTGG